MKLGAYDIVGRIARGSSADVFLATSAAHPRVALKILLPFLSDDPDIVAQFLSEGRLLQGITHPHLTRVYDVAQARGRTYIAMEHVDGCTLADVKVTAAQALTVTLAVLEALAHVHSFGIVHRDLTPHNVLLSRAGEVKLADFGVAKALMSKKTRTGAIKGQFAYMSPEHARGSLVDARSDVFSCALLAAELFSGARVYRAENELAVLDLAQRAAVPPFSLGAIGQVLTRALRPAPGDRFVDCSTFAEALRLAAASDGVTAATDLGALVPAANVEPVVADDLLLDDVAPVRRRLSPFWALLLLPLPLFFIPRSAPSVVTRAAVSVARAPDVPAPIPQPTDFGFLTVNSRPWSRVSIDAKPIGPTPLKNIRLAAGPHTLELTTATGLHRSLPIEITPNETLTRVVDWGDR